MKRILLLALSLTICPELCHANASPELMKLVDQQLSSVQAAVDQTDDFSIQVEGNESWIFRNIWLRLQAPIGFHVPGLVSVSVIPEFEVLIQRTLPDGWQVYQPPKEAGALEAM